MTLKNIAASVKQRLLNHAKETGRPYQELLQYYAMERFLYRLGNSEHVNGFVLKGAMLLRLLDKSIVRPTNDMDMLSKQTLSESAIRDIVVNVMAVAVEDDGLVFEPGSLLVEPIRLHARYNGVRCRFHGLIEKTRAPIQIDVGFGDIVIPKPELHEYPCILDFPPAEILIYSVESAIAEKFEAMVMLGLQNTRLKDFHDIWFLARRQAFDGEVLTSAIRETFKRRGTDLPNETPEALLPVFFENSQKQVQWNAFLRQIRSEQLPFQDVTTVLVKFLMPPTLAITSGASFKATWSPESLAWDE